IIKPFQTKSLLNKIKNEDIKIIHTNSSVVSYGAYLSRKSNVKHVWHIRENVNDMFDQSLKDMDHHITTITAKADCIIFISKSIKDYFFSYVEEKKQTNLNYRLIYNGLPLKPNSNTSNRDDGLLNIVSFGTLYKIKGQEDLVKLAEQLQNKLIKNFKIHLVGQQKQEYTRYLKTKMKELEVSDKFEFHGYKTELEPFRSLADIEVICSRNEAFGRVAIEALNHGNPLIVTSVGGLDEIVEHNKNGLKYSPGNITELFRNV
ncbi:glycosyltransferase family 4 protein, partial [Terribacillus saccharophilus]|uniref:glycosyltransferase family 4 protein n=1 Tax=Terribacillus saccharophilus TaxID=361277 RepID=UPI000BD57EE5